MPSQLLHFLFANGQAFKLVRSHRIAATAVTVERKARPAQIDIKIRTITRVVVVTSAVAGLLPHHGLSIGRPSKSKATSAFLSLQGLILKVRPPSSAHFLVW